MNLHIRGFAESSPQHNSQLTFSRIQNKGNIFDSFNWNAPGPDSRLVHRFGDNQGMVSIFMLSRDITPVCPAIMQIQHIFHKCELYE